MNTNQQQQQQPAAQEQDQQDLVTRVIQGMQSSFREDFKTLQDSIDNVKNECINQIDELRVHFNLKERSFKKVVQDGKPVYPSTQQVAPGSTAQLTRPVNVSVTNLGNTSNAAIDQQGQPFGAPSRIQTPNQQQQPMQEFGNANKRKRWLASETEITKRESYKSHIVIKFHRRRTHTDAVNTMGKIGRYLTRKVIPTSEPYTDPANTQLSRKYVLEFQTPEDVKDFRKAAQQLKRQEGPQTYSMDAHLTEQQKVIRAEIWAEYAAFMDHKQLSMSDGKIQLVFSVTNPWIILNNGPRVTCQSFREKYTSHGPRGNAGFTTDTYVNKKLHLSPSTETLNTIGTAPTPKLIDILQDMFIDHNTTDHNTNDQNNEMDTFDPPPVGDTSGNDNAFTEVTIEPVTQTTQLQVQNTSTTNNLHEHMRTITPVLLASQQAQDAVNEQVDQTVIGDLQNEQADSNKHIQLQQEAINTGLINADTDMEYPHTPTHVPKDKHKTTPLKVNSTLTKAQSSKAAANDRRLRNQEERDQRKENKGQHQQQQNTKQ